MSKIRKRAPILFAAAAVLYVAVVAGVAVVSVENGRKIVMASVDDRLKSAASTLKFLLAPDFHDRALDPESIGKDEELANRARVNAFVSATDFAWAYTLVERDGEYFFSAPTVSEKEALERDRWYFYPYKDIPAEFKDALKNGKSAYVTYRDQWGAYRSIALPEKSPLGRTYLSCVDLELKNLDGNLRKQLVRSVIGSLLLFLAGIPFVLLYAGELRAHNKLLQKMNERLQFDAYAAENRFQSLFEHSADAVAVADAQFRINYLNPAFAELFGWREEEISTKPFIIVPADLESEVVERLDRLKATREPYRDYDTRRLAKSGALLDVSISAAPLSDSRGEFAGALFIYRDRTQRKRLEARLAQDDKYRAVAAMAAGAAHDFNNALSVIQGNVSLLKMDTVFNGEAAALVQNIEDSVRNASALTGELLGFAHPDAAEKTRVDLGALCAQTARSFAKTRPGIRLSVDDPALPVYVMVQRSGLERILLNLLVNADHAMEGDGELSVRVCSAVFDADQATARSLAPGRYAVVRVSDSGSGMDADTMSHIFEPFFTTKKKGKGTGLGLASVYASLRGFGGSVMVESENGKGSIFTFFLPDAADFTASEHTGSMEAT